MDELSRRGFIAGACAIALGGLGALPAAAESSIKRLRNGQVTVKLRSIPDLNKVGGSVAIGKVRGIPAAIARTGTSSYIAFSLACPHQKVIVGKTETGWRCAAHGSEFEPDGDLVLGPATTRLTRIPIKVSRGVATVG